MDNSFRKLPVDLYSEDLILESDLYSPDSRSPSQVLEETKSKHSQIKLLLQKSQIKPALEIVLVDYPFGENVDEAKVSWQALIGERVTVLGRSINETRGY